MITRIVAQWALVESTNYTRGLRIRRPMFLRIPLSIFLRLRRPMSGKALPFRPVPQTYPRLRLASSCPDLMARDIAVDLISRRPRQDSRRRSIISDKPLPVVETEIQRLVRVCLITLWAFLHKFLPRAIYRFCQGRPRVSSIDAGPHHGFNSISIASKTVEPMFLIRCVVPAFCQALSPAFGSSIRFDRPGELISIFES